MKILLTGCTGNLGSHILEALSKNGYDICCLVRPSKINQKKMAVWQGRSNIKVIWGNLWNEEQVIQAMVGQDIIVHTAYLIPPAGLERPEEAERTNIQGMQTLIKAAKLQEKPPKFWFASSYAVFGPEAALKSEPVYADDATSSTNMYTQQKLECENMLCTSGLTWSIFRFSDVVPMAAQSPTKLMYDIPLQIPMEFIHPADAALAIVHGIEGQAIWNKLLLIGGGKECQILYEEYLRRSLAVAGLDMLPRKAFNPNGIWGTAWLDTRESQQLLQYQRHTLDEIYRDVEAATAPSPVVKVIIKVMRPLITKKMLSLSPYYKV